MERAAHMTRMPAASDIAPTANPTVPRAVVADADLPDPRLEGSYLSWVERITGDLDPEVEALERRLATPIA